MNDPSDEASPAVSPKRSGRRAVTLRDWAWPTTTYFAEGLPWSLLHQVAAEFFTALGAPPSAIGRTSLLHGPMVLKAVWSPFVEAWGSLRSWMVATQAVMGVLVGWVALLADTLMRADASRGDTFWLWIALLGIGVVSATHDIACDGYYMEVFDAGRQARFSGLRVASFRFAMMVGSSGLVFLAGRAGWLWGFLVGAGLLLALAVLHQMFLPRVTHAQKDNARAKPSRAATLDAYWSFLRQDSVWLVIAFLLSYKMADVLMFSMAKVLLGRELGLGTELRGLIGFFSVGASILGAIVGGLWVARRGLARSLFPITLLMALTEPLFAVLSSFAPRLTLAQGGLPATLESIHGTESVGVLVLVTSVVVIEQICGGLATAAQVVFIMRRCDPAHKTTHYAFATVVYSVAHIVLGTTSGFAFEALGSTGYFWTVSALTIPAVALARMVPLEQRKTHTAPREVRPAR